MKRLKSIIKFQHTYSHSHPRGSIEKFERYVNCYYVVFGECAVCIECSGRLLAT